MFVFIMAILISAFLLSPLNSYIGNITFSANPTLFITAGTISWLIAIFLMVFIQTPLQRIEKTFSPYAIVLFQKDKTLRWQSFFLYFFAFLSYIIAILQPELSPLYQEALLILWIVSLGAAIDISRHYINRAANLLNPFYLLSLFNREAQHHLNEDNSLEICRPIDALSISALKSLTQYNTMLCQHALDEILSIVHHFLNHVTSLSYNPKPLENKLIDENSSETSNKENMTSSSSSDEVQYILYYVFQKLEFINEKAIESKYENVSSHIIAILGKISIFGAKLDFSLAHYPIASMGNCAKAAQQKGLKDVPIKTTCALVQVANILINEIDVTYVDLKPAFFSIIGRLDEIAKTTFSQDKSISIKILMQPFVDLKALMANPKIVSHQDTAAIVNDLDRVLAEFATLELVLRSIPGLGEKMQTSEEKDNKDEKD